MIKTIVHYFKIFILFLADLLQSFEKFLKFIISGKHEVERICDSNVDTHERTLRIDSWLDRSHCKPIQSFLKKHFESHDLSPDTSVDRAIGDILAEYDKDGSKSHEDATSRGKFNDGSSSSKNNKAKKAHKRSFREHKNLEEHDIALASALREATNELVDIIVQCKCLQRTSARCRVRLRDSIYRIVGYKLSIRLAEQFARISYDSKCESHTSKLMSLWNELLQSDQSGGNELQEEGDKHMRVRRAFPPELSQKISDSKDIVSSRWSHIGFQGEDPGTDFRGMGLWGLCQLEYLARRPKRLAADLLIRSNNEKHSYPMAIVGINISYNQLCLMRNGCMKDFYFDTGDQLFRGYDRTLNVISTLNDLYVELFLRFDCFWHESKPENIFEFKQLMENFVNVIEMDLCDRNFALKFIY